MEAAVHRKLFGYGVWRAPVLIDELPAIWAVDSFGVVRKVRKIRPGEDETELGDRLWLWLREHHPERRLELVREAPIAQELVRHPVSRRMIDARLLTDPRSPLARRRYLDTLVANAARRSLPFRRDT